MSDSENIQQLEHELAAVEALAEVDKTRQIDVLNDLAWALRDTDIKRAYSLGERAYALANGASKATTHGEPFYQAGQAYSLRTHGYLNLRLGNHTKGLAQLFKAQEICEALQLDICLTDVLDNIAGIYFQISNFPISLDYMYRQLEAAQRTGDKRLIANAYNNLANIYFETGEYERAIETLHKNLQCAREINYKRIEVLSYLNLAETYLLAGKYDQALGSAFLALPLCQVTSFELFEGYAFDFIGKAYLKLGDVAQAIQYLEKALERSRKVESRVSQSLILLNLGEAYRAGQQFDIALDYLQQAVATAEAIQAKSELYKGHLLLSETFEALGDYFQALHHFKQHHVYMEMVTAEKTDERVQVLQLTHETEVARSEAKIQRLKNVELKRAIAELQQRDEQLSLLESMVANTNDAILIVAADPIDGQVGNILYANTALIELTGYSQEELVGQPPRIFQGPESDAMVLRQIREAIRQRKRFRAELINYSKAGAKFWVELDIIPIMDDAQQVSHWVAVRRDISQRKAIEHALQLERERYQLATHAAAVGVWDWNVQTGEFYLDPVVKAILGYSDLEIPNNLELWAGYVHPEDREAVMAAAQAHLDGETPEYLYEHRMLHKDGSVRWILVRGKAIRDAKGQVVRLVGTDADITARKEVEDRLRQMNDRLEQQVKIRTTELRDTIEMLRQEIKDRELARAELQHVLVSLEQRVTARTEELVTFFDLTVLAGQATSLTDLFEQTLPRVLEVTRSRVICLHLIDDDYSSLRLIAQQNLPDRVRQQMQSLAVPPPFQRWLEQQNDPLITTTLAQTTLPAVFHLSEYTTYLGAQIRVDSHTEGLLSCYGFPERGYSLDEIALVTALAEQMGMMLEIHRLRQSTREVAVVEERQRLARDLHDSVTQLLYSLSLLSRAGREAFDDGDDERLTNSLNQLEQNTLHALREMRLLLYELRPADLEEEGLVKAVRLRLDTVERRVGMQLEVHMDDFSDMMSWVEVELYHVIVEALNNVVKHAGATCLALYLSRVEQQLHLYITDNGHGFDMAQVSGGLGLRNIRERVSCLNGQFTIFSQPDGGTRLEAIIPYPVEVKR